LESVSERDSLVSSGRSAPLDIVGTGFPGSRVDGGMLYELLR